MIYRFRVVDREAVALDIPALIGRAPRPPRVPGAPVRLVTVESPESSVSATHLEIRQVGESVVVTDLRSTNGTVVSVPGSIPRRLQPGESIVAVPGTEIDLGDGNLVEILPVQRLRAPGE